jgi:non-ribosomal peptide synthetase component E (peptide arylation enzyme)
MMLMPASRRGAGRDPIDEMVRRHAERRPEAVALIDPADKTRFCDGEPRRMTWADVEAAVAAVASRLRDLGLSTDNTVVLQGPNISELLIAILGCQRAHLIPVLLPSGWRNREAVAAVERVGARAILAATRAGPHRPAEELRHVAAENFSVRFVCGFGAEMPDGVISFNDCMEMRLLEPAAQQPRLGNPAEQVAITTWDCGARGPYPAPRSHNEGLALGHMVRSELDLCADDILLSSLSPSGIAGLATGLLPWVLSGCTLVLNQGLSLESMAAQIDGDRVTHCVLPAVAARAMLQEGLLAAAHLAQVAAITRSFGLAEALPEGSREIAAFGELALLPMTRRDGLASIPLGRIENAAEEAAPLLETGLTRDGMLAVRGACVPRAAFPGNDKGIAYPLESDDWIATGFPARVEGAALVVTGGRRDVASIGGETLALAAVEALYSDVDAALGVTARAVADPILGERLVLEAMPAHAGALDSLSLARHAEAKGASPLASKVEARIGDRRSGRSLDGTVAIVA